MKNPALGSVESSKTISEKPNIRIDKVVSHVAYPRNGNVGNPTVTYAWLLYVDSRLVDRFQRLRDAIAEAPKYVE